MALIFFMVHSLGKRYEAKDDRATLHLLRKLRNKLLICYEEPKALISFYNPSKGREAVRSVLSYPD